MLSVSCLVILEWHITDRSTRHAAVFRDQEINVHEQLELARHFGRLHKHATTGVPREPGLEEVHSEFPGASWCGCNGGC